MLNTKCIFDLPSSEDGVRVSVMSRHTHNDGKTPEERIKPRKTFDLHWPKVAPPDLLIGWYYRHLAIGESRIGLWNGKFKPEYLSYLRKPEVTDHVKMLARMAMEKEVTIMCVEDSPTYCHRSLLAEECKRIEPRLEVRHVV